MEKEMKTKSMFKMSIKKMASFAIPGIIILIFILGLTIPTNSAQEIYPSLRLEIDSLKYRDTSIFIDSPIQIDKQFEFKHEMVKKDLIAEVEKYIAKQTKGKAHPNLAEYIVENAIEHNIDICFMMSQTLIETNFGTAGAGRPTSRRSLFGVIKKKYANYDDAIDDWCKLLKKSYLTKGRTEHDLMKRYVTTGGARYAGANGYEVKLSNTYKTINSKTSITSLQKEYKEAYQTYLAELKKTTENEIEATS